MAEPPSKPLNEVQPEKEEEETKGRFPWSGLTKEYIVKEVLLGTTIGFAQVPESIAFAQLARVKPPVALHAAWIVGLICSLFGGRPGMVNGATGAFAAVIASFLEEPLVKGGNGGGIETLFPSVMGAGVLMLFCSVFKLSRFILLLPSPVMLGFCNGLAFVIGLAQLHPFEGKKIDMEFLFMVIIMMSAMLLMEFCPKIPLKIFKIIPSSLLGIIAAVIIQECIATPLGHRTDTVGDMNKFTSDTAYPVPFFVTTTAYKYDYDDIGSSKNIQKICIQSALLFVVGTIESLMTSEVVESFVKTPSDGDRTVLAMGAGNLVSGFLGGMGGNAMIGLSTINVLNGGKGRLAPCCTALLVMISITGAYEMLNYIPVAALAGIMLVVVIHTFKWFTLPMMFTALLPQKYRKALSTERYSFDRKIPRTEAAVIFIVSIIAGLGYIAYAVIIGVCICSLQFSWNMGSGFSVKESVFPDKKIYEIDGPLFFVSANKLVKLLKVDSDPSTVEVHFGINSTMDYSAIETMHKISCSYKSKDKKVTFHSVNASSEKLIKKSNALVRSIEYSTGSAMTVPQIPSTLPSPNGHAATQMPTKEVDKDASAQPRNVAEDPYKVEV